MVWLIPDGTRRTAATRTAPDRRISWARRTTKGRGATQTAATSHAADFPAASVPPPPARADKPGATGLLAPRPLGGLYARRRCTRHGDRRRPDRLQQQRRTNSAGREHNRRGRIRNDAAAKGRGQSERCGGDGVARQLPGPNRAPGRGHPLLRKGAGVGTGELDCSTRLRPVACRRRETRRRRVPVQNDRRRQSRRSSGSLLLRRTAPELAATAHPGRCLRVPAHDRGRFRVVRRGAGRAGSSGPRLRLPGGGGHPTTYQSGGDTVSDTTTKPVISPDLLAILVCPVDKQDVRLEGTNLICTACGRSYPIEDGIPNMLVD